MVIALLNPVFSAFLCAQETKDADPLKIALLPILDTFPYYVAEANQRTGTRSIDAVR
jgi:hypothetical protein